MVFPSSARATASASSSPILVSFGEGWQSEERADGSADDPRLRDAPADRLRLGAGAPGQRFLLDVVEVDDRPVAAPVVRVPLLRADGVSAFLSQTASQSIDRRRTAFASSSARTLRARSTSRATRSTRSSSSSASVSSGSSAARSRSRSSSVGIDRLLQLAHRGGERVPAPLDEGLAVDLRAALVHGVDPLL